MRCHTRALVGRESEQWLHTPLVSGIKPGRPMTRWFRSSRCAAITNKWNDLGIETHNFHICKLVEGDRDNALPNTIYTRTPASACHERPQEVLLHVLSARSPSQFPGVVKVY
jgi:hypothetical protein